MRSKSVVNIDSNVNIKVIDKNGVVKRNSDIHNKATVNLVDGLLRFLKGDFTKVFYSDSAAPEDGSPYIPTQVRFGRVGVKLKTNETSGKRNFDYEDRSELSETVFSTSSLQEPCYQKFDELQSSDPVMFKFDKVRQVGYSDLNNSECLEFSAYITPGTLVGKSYQEQDPDDPDKIRKVFKPYHYSYWNPEKNEYEAIITEIALTSDHGVLLARVLFDGKIKTESNSQGTYPVLEDPNGEFSPIIQSQSNTVVITWRLGIVSVGKGDKFVTENDLSLDEVSEELSEKVINDYQLLQKDSGSQVDVLDFKNYLYEELSKILNGKTVSEIGG